MMQEIERIQTVSNEQEEPELMRKNCHQKMMQANLTSQEKDAKSNNFSLGEGVAATRPKKTRPINLK